MKYLLPLNENFKLVDLGNHNWYGSKPDPEYFDRVKSYCLDIMMDESETSEKAFSRIDRLVEIYDKLEKERHQEIDAIIHNCKVRNMRPQMCAETIYHSVIQGRLASLMERPWDFGGLS